MTKARFPILFFILLVSSCDVQHTRNFRSYITEYWDVDAINLQITDNGNMALVGTGARWLCGWKSEGREKVMYDSLCLLHNDMNYNKKRDYIVGPDWGNNYKGDIVSISVVSDADFDEQHPASSSLNDMIRFMSVSLNPYIQSGYKDSFDWENNFPKNFNKEQGSSFFHSNYGEAPCYHPIDKKLSEITPYDLMLVDLLSYYKTGHLIGFLAFEKQPELVKEHNLRVRIEISDGRVFTPTITKKFE